MKANGGATKTAPKYTSIPAGVEWVEKSDSNQIYARKYFKATIHAHLHVEKRSSTVRIRNLAPEVHCSEKAVCSLAGENK